MAEQVGYANPYRFQHFVLDERSGARCSICAEIRQYAFKHLKGETDILAIDKQGFLKQENSPLGYRHYVAITGHEQNCQVGVSVLHQ